jgi:hypothetical protein
MDAPVFVSLLTRPYRFATRGAELTVRGTIQAVEIAGSVVGAVAGRILGHSHNGDDPEMTPVTQMPPDTRTPDRTSGADAPVREDPRLETEMPSGPDAPVGQEARPSAEGPPAPEPSPAERSTLDAEEPASTPEPPSAARRLAAETRDDPAPPPLAGEPVSLPDDEPASPFADEPAHVSEEPVLVEEIAEPGAEDGAGAQLRILEPWPGYKAMKAADIISRLASASREELAAVELYELAGRNRKSVVAAAQQALKQASPPR